WLSQERMIQEQPARPRPPMLAGSTKKCWRMKTHALPTQKPESSTCSTKAVGGSRIGRRSRTRLQDSVLKTATLQRLRPSFRDSAQPNTLRETAGLERCCGMPNPLAGCEGTIRFPRKCGWNARAGLSPSELNIGDMQSETVHRNLRRADSSAL